MALYNYALRKADGTYLTSIPPESWIYFDYERVVNDVGYCEGVLSTALYPELRDAFYIGMGDPRDNLDGILEIWRQPRDGPTGQTLRPRLDAQYLIRYNRNEETNDARRRLTVIGRDQKHLISRCNVHPRGAIPPEGQSTTDFTAVFPWTLPTTDTFTGPPHLGTGYGNDTAEIMWAMAARCQVTNPVAFATTHVTVPGAPSTGGIPDHRISERYTPLLEALQTASGASWYASYFGYESTPADNGCDFDLVAASTPPYFPWTFTVFPGGRGTDRRIGTTRPMVFSDTLGNILQPVTITDHLDEKTRIIAAGAGDGLNRDILLVTKPTAIGRSPLNKNEEFVDARRAQPFALGPPVIGFGDVLMAGQNRLKENGVREAFTFLVSGSAEYGRDYDLGDLVTAAFQDKQEDYQIRSIRVLLDTSGAEAVTVEFGSLDGMYWKGQDSLDQIISVIKDVEDQASGLETAQ